MLKNFSFDVVVKFYILFSYIFYYFFYRWVYIFIYIGVCSKLWLNDIRLLWIFKLVLVNLNFDKVKVELFYLLFIEWEENELKEICLC